MGHRRPPLLGEYRWTTHPLCQCPHVCAGDDKFFIISHRHQLLKDLEGAVTVSGESGPEKWSISDAGDGKFFLTSHRSQQLEDVQGTIGLSGTLGDWQKWTVSDAGDGQFFLTSYWGKQLTDVEGTVGLQPSYGPGETWSIPDFTLPSVHQPLLPCLATPTGPYKPNKWACP